MELKDSLSISISILALGLSVLSVVRAQLLERKLFIEPYFERLFVRKHSNIVSQLYSASQSYFSIDAWLDSKEERETCPTAFPDSNLAVLDDTASKYAKTLAEQLRLFADLHNRLNESIRSYNKLMDATDEAARQIMVMTLGEYGEPSPQVRKRIEYWISVEDKYCPGVTRPTTRDILANPSYRQDLQVEKERIARLLERLKAVHAKLSELVALYEARLIKRDER